MINGKIEYSIPGSLDIRALYTKPNFDYLLFEDQEYVLQQTWSFKNFDNYLKGKSALCLCSFDLNQYDYFYNEAIKKINSTDKFTRRSGKRMLKEVNMFIDAWYPSGKLELPKWAVWIQSESRGEDPIFFKLNP
jgi:hypothetical protein